MERYRFSVGDSNTGAVGFAITFEGETQEEALNFLRYTLAEAEDGIAVRLDIPVLSHGVLFLNTDHITEDDIEEVVEDAAE